MVFTSFCSGTLVGDLTWPDVTWSDMTACIIQSKECAWAMRYRLAMRSFCWLYAVAFSWDDGGPDCWVKPAPTAPDPPTLLFGHHTNIISNRNKMTLGLSETAAAAKIAVLLRFEQVSVRDAYYQRLLNCKLYQLLTYQHMTATSLSLCCTELPLLKSKMLWMLWKDWRTILTAVLHDSISSPKV